MGNHGKIGGSHGQGFWSVGEGSGAMSLGGSLTIILEVTCEIGGR